MSEEIDKSKHKPTLASKLLEMKSKFHIFKEMNDADILAIVRNISFRKYSAGEIIVREGEVGLIYFISLVVNVMLLLIELLLVH